MMFHHKSYKTEKMGNNFVVITTCLDKVYA